MDRHGEGAVRLLLTSDGPGATELSEKPKAVAVKADLEADDLLSANGLLQRGRRIQRDDLAVIDDRHAVAELVGLLHVVRRQKDRAALRAKIANAVAQIA